MMLKRNILLIFLTATLCSVYADDVYSSVNESGVSVLSNKSTPNSQKVSYSQDASALNSQIQQINKELSDKQQKKQGVDTALQNTKSAISKSAALLKKLTAQRDADLQQLQQLQITIPQLTDATAQAKTQVSKSMGSIYQQLKTIENQQGSLLSGNSSIDTERKQMYLVQILKVQNGKLTELNGKLTTLQDLNNKLQQEVERLSNKVNETTQHHDGLLTGLDKTKQQSDAMQKQIELDKSKLSNLKKRQAELNKLLNQIAAQERKQKAQQLAAMKAAAKQKKKASSVVVVNKVSSSNSNVPVQATVDTSSEDNSPFLSRKLVTPISGNITVGFGKSRDGVRNNGTLVAAADNAPVYAVSSGTVMFSGELPGFGQIVVIDNGDNYTSVYSGIIARVKKGAKVNGGEQIASSGTSANQPMNGVYFELRHLGKPVNPTKIFSQ